VLFQAIILLVRAELGTVL